MSADAPPESRSPATAGDRSPPAAGRPAPPAGAARTVLVAAVVAVVAALLPAPARSDAWLGDLDRDRIVHGPAAHGFDWTADAGRPAMDPDLPLLSQVLTRVEGMAWGPSPAAWRAAGAVLHGLTAFFLVLALVGLLRGWGVRARWPALLGALAWAVHPARMEAAAWIGRRPEAWAVLLAVLACACAWHPPPPAEAGRRARRTVRRLGAAVFAVAAGLAAPVGVAAPLVVVVGLSVGRRAGEERGAGAAAWIGAALATAALALAHGSVAGLPADGMGWLRRGLSWLIASGVLARSELVPLDMDSLRAPAVAALPQAQLGSLLAGAGLLLAATVRPAWVRRHTRRGTPVGPAGWASTAAPGMFALALLPALVTAGPAGVPATEAASHLAGVALAVLVTGIAGAAARRGRLGQTAPAPGPVPAPIPAGPRAAAVAGMVAVAALGTLAWGRAPDFRSDDARFAADAPEGRDAPADLRPLLHRSRRAVEQADWTEALALAERGRGPLQAGRPAVRTDSIAPAELAWTEGLAHLGLVGRRTDDDARLRALEQAEDAFNRALALADQRGRTALGLMPPVGAEAWGRPDPLAAARRVVRRRLVLGDGPDHAAVREVLDFKARVLTSRAQLRTTLGRYDAALVDLRRAVRGAPWSPAPRPLLATLLAERDLRSLAFRDLQPARTVLRARRSLLQRMPWRTRADDDRLRDVESALADVDLDLSLLLTDSAADLRRQVRLLEADPSAVEQMDVREGADAAEVIAGLEEVIHTSLRRARAMLAEVRSLRPGDPETDRRLARVEAVAGNPDGELRHLAAAARASGSGADAMHLMDRAVALKGAAGAAAAVERLFERPGPGERSWDWSSAPEVLQRRVRLLQSAGRLDDAVAAAEQAVRARRDESSTALLAEALAARARVLRDAGQWDAGWEDVERALELDPEVPGLRLLGVRDPAERARRARPWLEKAAEAAGDGRLLAAIPLFRRALVEAPDMAGARAAMARLLLGVGRPEAAAREARRALESDTATADAHLVLGDLAAARGETAERDHRYRLYLALAPRGGEAERVRAALGIDEDDERDDGDEER